MSQMAEERISTTGLARIVATSAFQEVRAVCVPKPPQFPVTSGTVAATILELLVFEIAPMAQK
jgi:hypothetical protein